VDDFLVTAPVESVEVRRLPPLTRLLIWTANSLYQVVVWRGSRVYVRGGPFFPRFTAAHLDGAWLGDGLPRTGWITTGLRLEIRAGKVRIVTTPVRIIAAERSMLEH
jgi:hypothetical protein